MKSENWSLGLSISNPNIPKPNRSCVDYLSDLRQQVMDELERIAPRHASGLNALPSDAEIIEGAVVLDSRNFACKGTVFSVSKRKYIVRFGEKMEGVQYWTLTAEGLEAVRSNRAK